MRDYNFYVMELKGKWVSFYYVNYRRIRKKIKIATCHFVQNFISYFSANYYLNWFTLGKVFEKNKKGELIFQIQCNKPGLSFFVHYHYHHHYYHYVHLM